MRRAAYVACVGACFALTWTALGGTIVAGGDPDKARVIWADPFDWYTQYYYDTYVASDPSAIYSGGPTPAGDSNGTYPDKGPCQVTMQNTPAVHQMARAKWVSNNCPNILAPAGFPTATPSNITTDFANGAPCGSGGRVETPSMDAQLDSRWNSVQGFTSMGQFTYDLLPRIQAIAANRNLGTRNAVNGTDEDPLVVVFWLGDGGGCSWEHDANNVYSWQCAYFGMYNNSYVELALDDATAPTDYAWRGNRNGLAGDPERCPTGPFPVICQQKREVNGNVSEDGSDLTWLEQACGPIKPAFDPNTGTGKTWSAMAFGILSILDKDPCGELHEGDAHCPTLDHFTVFDGNRWREIRSARFGGLANASTSQGIDEGHWNGDVWVPGTTYGMPEFWPPEQNLILGAPAGGNDFTIGVGYTLVYIKIVTNYMYVYANSPMVDRPDLQSVNPSNVRHAWHAAIPRIYKGPFNKIRWGVGPGCELDPATGECKPNKTRRCLTYGGLTNNGYWRPFMDAMSIFTVNNTPDDNLVYIDTTHGACCNRADGSCTFTDQVTCQASPDNRWDGVGTVCGQFLCCPNQYGDTDADGDVDMVDFAVLQKCLTRTGEINSQDAKCACLDSEQDGDIDLDDAVHFADCASGADVAASPACRTW